MNILLLNGSPRPNGNTAKMVDAFIEGAKNAGHTVNRMDICRMKIGGCLACEYCHTKDSGKCVQKDDMQQIYPLLKSADMLVLASPIYYHNFSGQLQCAINRFYACGSPKELPKLKRAALILSSGDDHVYGGAMYEYDNSFLGYLGLENMGVFTAHGEEQCTDEKLEELRRFGAGLKDRDEKAEFQKQIMFPIGEPNPYGQFFIGQSYLATVSAEQAPCFNVTFEPGCRNNWHIHHASSGGGQMLICIGGRGWYQEWGKEPVKMTPGIVINIPPEVKHWHGAAADSWFAHLAFEIGGTDTSNEWCEPVGDAEYDRLAQSGSK